MVLIQRSRTQLKSDLKMGSCFMTKNGKFIFSRKTKSFIVSLAGTTCEESLLLLFFSPGFTKELE